MILVVDNYDSFVYTLVAYLRQLGADVEVHRNDDVPTHLDQFAGVLLSPGPGAPDDAGQCLAVVNRCAELAIPLLGVCLGHQALAAAFGGHVGHAPELRHGKTSQVRHHGTGVFAGLPSPMTATRYHSLAVSRAGLPAELEVTAWTGVAADAGVIMGLAHPELPLHGVQFHPESVMTFGGHVLLANWLAITGDPGARDRAAGLNPGLPGQGPSMT